MQIRKIIYILPLLATTRMDLRSTLYEDQKIIDTGRRLIEELNQRYGRKDIFFSFTVIANGMPVKVPGWAGKEKGSDRIQ